MGLDEKLARLRKERELRRRAQPASVESAWSEIDRDDGLSVKQKLERLIALTGGAAAATGARRPRPAPRAAVEVFENAYPALARYGKSAIADGLRVKGPTLAALGRDPAFEVLDLETALFLDLETTGLAGGTGTLPFLVGLGFYRDGRFRIVQFFLGDPGEEARLVADLGRFLIEAGFRSLVTYNGKAFDLPLLETRFILHRAPLPLAGLPHLDLLFPARSLWKHRHQSCRLFHLARQIVEAGRDEDIPGAEIPIRYFSYLRGGDFGLIEPVLDHNREDLLSLLGLVISAAELLEGGARPDPEEALDALDLVGVGRILEGLGEIGRSIELFRKALQDDLPGELAASLKRKLSYHYKRAADWESAVGLWKDLSGRDRLFCYRELAMYYEHKAKDTATALSVVEEGLVLARGISETYRKDFERRLARLRGRGRRA